MTFFRSHLRIILLLVLVLIMVGTFIAPAFLRTSEGEAVLRVVFFDVGQGDAVYIESPTGTQILIDAGPDGGILRHLESELGFFDRELDYILASHADLDHIGGFPDVLERYDVGTIIMTENEGQSDAAETFLERTKSEGAEIIFARRGMAFDLGGGAELEILFPDLEPHFLETNTASIVARLTYGEAEFLFTGDAPSAIEEYLVARDGNTIQSDVLKVGHHGSKTSSSELFLRVVQPALAVVSAGSDNRYGHPHHEVMDRFHLHGIETKNTAEDGSVVFVSDGVEVFAR